MPRCASQSSAKIVLRYRSPESHRSVTIDPCSPFASISDTRRATPHMFVPVDPPQERPRRRESTRAAAMLAASGTGKAMSIRSALNEGSHRCRPIPSIREGGRKGCRNPGLEHACGRQTLRDLQGRAGLAVAYSGCDGPALLTCLPSLHRLRSRLEQGGLRAPAGGRSTRLCCCCRASPWRARQR